MALRRLANGDSHYSVGEMFGVAACTSVKTSKKFVKSFWIAAIPSHLKWPIGEGYQPKVTTLKFVLVRVIVLKPAPTLNTVHPDKYKALVLKNTARLMLVALPPYQLTTA